MARAVLGPLLGDLRGKVGAVVFNNYKGVHLTRSLPSVITNPKSAHQVDVRAAMTVFVDAWRTLTLDQKKLWGQLAAGFIRGTESDARMNRGSLIPLPRGPFSGYNAFIACNMNRYTSGYSLIADILEDAPIDEPKPEPLESFSLTAVPGTLTPAWTYITPGPLNARLVIWVKSIDAKIHPQLIYTEPRNADGDTNITQVRGLLGVWTCPPGGVWQAQARIINEFGLASPPSGLAFVQVEDVPIGFWNDDDWCHRAWG